MREKKEFKVSDRILNSEFTGAQHTDHELLSWIWEMMPLLHC